MERIPVSNPCVPHLPPASLAKALQRSSSRCHMTPRYGGPLRDYLTPWASGHARPANDPARTHRLEKMNYVGKEFNLPPPKYQADALPPMRSILDRWIATAEKWWAYNVSSFYVETVGGSSRFFNSGTTAFSRWEPRQRNNRTPSDSHPTAVNHQAKSFWQGHITMCWRLYIERFRGTSYASATAFSNVSSSKLDAHGLPERHDRR